MPRQTEEETIMQKILVDACGWVAVIDSGMNFDSEISRLLGRPEVLLLPKVLEELERLQIQRPRSKSLLLEMLIAKSSSIEPPIEAGEHTDDQLVQLAHSRSMVVLTIDGRLKRRLFERGVPVLEISKKKRLSLLEGL